MEYSFWNFNTFKGSVGLEGNYFYKSSALTSGVTGKLKTYELFGLLSFLTDGFIIHPKFISIEVDGLFRLGTRGNNYIVTPSETSIITSDKLSLKTTVFRSLPISGEFFLSYDHSFISRDFYSNIENKKMNLGAQFDYRKSVIPFSIRYDYSDWLQKEIDFNRSYSNTKHNLHSQFSQSYEKYITNNLQINYSDFDRQYSTSDKTNSSKIFGTDLKTRIRFEKLVNLNYYSIIGYNQQRGFDNRKRFQLLQNLKVELPYNFGLILNYEYHNLSSNHVASENHLWNCGLNHQLFKSLKSYVSYEASDYMQTTFNELSDKFRIGFNYIKKIPTGSINMVYSYINQNKSQESINPLHISTDEDHIINDNEIELLDYPGILPNTIIVTDIENLIVYQKDYDYEIIERGDFTEIRRLIGGQIPNGSVVLVDYEYYRDDSFSYMSTGHSYSFGINLFNNFIEARYSRSDLTYDNVENIDVVVLKEISQNIYSLKINYGGVSIGYEYDSFQSNIVPYKSFRIYGKYSYILQNMVILSLSTNYREMTLLENNLAQEYFDIIGMMTYAIGLNSKLVVEGSRRTQIGRSTDLALYKFKTEYQTSFRSVQIYTGIEYYNRSFINDQINYFNGYIKLRRNF